MHTHVVGGLTQQKKKKLFWDVCFVLYSHCVKEKISTLPWLGAAKPSQVRKNKIEWGKTLSAHKPRFSF